MSKHTPGPWVRSPQACDSEDWAPTCADAEWIVLGKDDEGLPVAIVCGEYLGGDAGRLEANAKLIAAAPDLLAALIKLSNEALGTLPLMEELCRREFGNTNYAILIQRAEEARASIAKATGAA